MRVGKKSVVLGQGTPSTTWTQLLPLQRASASPLSQGPPSEGQRSGVQEMWVHCGDQGEKAWAGGRGRERNQ